MPVMIYSGPLHYKKNGLSGLAKLAYGVYATQKSRCNNRNNPKYKNYGARGIRVEYSAREFVGWYMQNTQDKDCVSIGRIDHDKNYSLDNIKVETISENSIERNRRKPKNRACYKSVEIYRACDMQRVGIAGSVQVAALATGANKTLIKRYCTGRLKQTKAGFTFRWAETCR